MRFVQHSLAALGYQTGPADGQLKAETVRAIREFEMDRRPGAERSGQRRTDGPTRSARVPEALAPLSLTPTAWAAAAAALCLTGMRLKSELWVKAYLRRCAVEGAPALLERRGDADAGPAIHIKVSRLDGSAGPIGAGAASLGAKDAERRWQQCLASLPAAEAEADRYLAQQLAFDPDLWIIVVEDRQGRHFLDDWLAPV